MDVDLATVGKRDLDLVVGVLVFDVRLGHPCASGLGERCLGCTRERAPCDGLLLVVP